MIVFNTDLDNTLIYSYKQNIGANKRCVEIYQNREISFITTKTYELLKMVQARALIVPTTTRTTEQYSRINLGVEMPRYALTCNGGVLLIDGNEDNEWYNRSLGMVENCQNELSRAEKILENDRYRSFEVRNIKNLFIFTKSNEPEKTVESLKSHLDNSIMNIFSNGVKVYAVPKTLSKGTAVDRFRKFVDAGSVISAGDSEFDISMLEGADIAIAPERLRNSINSSDGITFMDDTQIFSEAVLEFILHKI